MGWGVTLSSFELNYKVIYILFFKVSFQYLLYFLLESFKRFAFDVKLIGNRKKTENNELVYLSSKALKT